MDDLTSRAYHHVHTQHLQIAEADRQILARRGHRDFVSRVATHKVQARSQEAGRLNVGNG